MSAVYFDYRDGYSTTGIRTLSGPWFYAWRLNSEEGDSLLHLCVPTRALAWRAVELWQRSERAQAREDAGAPRHCGSHSAGTFGFCKFRARDWRRHWSRQRKAGEAFCRFVEFCQRHKFDACLYGTEPSDVDPYYSEFMEALIAALAAHKGGVSQ